MIRYVCQRSRPISMLYYANSIYNALGSKYHEEMW